jgi:hypothetical protein
MVVWNQSLSASEPAVPASRVNVTGTGSDRFAEDAVSAMLYRASSEPSMELSAGAAAMANRPLWAVAGHALEVAGLPVDMYGSREQIAEDAMAMGDAARRQTFFSTNEDRRYAQNASIPTNRPGDFPNILSNLANKFLDTVLLDDDYSFTQVSALLPGGLNDFKPALKAFVHLIRGFSMRPRCICDCGQVTCQHGGVFSGRSQHRVYSLHRTQHRGQFLDTPARRFNKQIRSSLEPMRSDYILIILNAEFLKRLSRIIRRLDHCNRGGPDLRCRNARWGALLS